MMAVLFVLFVALIGSVLIPGGEISRIGQLLDEDERVNEPARLNARRSVELIVQESLEGRRYAARGDAASLRRLQNAAIPREKALVGLREFAARSDDAVSRAVAEVDPLIDHWHRLQQQAGGTATSLARFRDSADVREAVSDSLVVALSRVQTELAHLSAQRRAAIWSHARRGLLANMTLVLGSLVALTLVVESGRRERRRARQEGELRAAAESLAAALTVEEVAQRIATSARALLAAQGVCVERLENRDGGVVVVEATDGAGIPPAGTETRLNGSVAERAIRAGRTTLVTGELKPNSSTLRESSRHPMRMIAIPLGRAGETFGVVFALESRQSRSRDLPVADIFADLASLTYTRVRLLDETREARSHLQRAMESRSRLMRGFSHDVKNPLGAANGYAALLSDGMYGEITEKQRESLDRIRELIQRALSLIDDLHELARAEAGKIALRFARTNVAELVVALGEEHRAAAEAKGLRLVINADPALPEVNTDASRLRQIIGNLLSNAIKYTNAGSVTLTARAIKANGTDGGGDIVVDVADTGPGIPREQVGQLFQEFARGADEKQPGAGIGLAISRLLADALGFHMQVTSEVGSGSTFSLHIPVDASPDRAF
jgi:signal transduction histidine kinase